nr:hypothetical protein [Tanacetum cinerariifolium]
MVIHAKKTEMMRLVVEIKCDGKIVDMFDKATGSSDGLQPEQVDLNYVYALNEPHLHEIRVVLMKISSRSHVMIPPSSKQTYRTHHKAYSPFLVSSRKSLWRMILVALISQSAWIASVANNSEYFFGLVTPFSSIFDQRSEPFSKDFKDHSSMLSIHHV